MPNMAELLHNQLWVWALHKNILSQDNVVVCSVFFLHVSSKLEICNLKSVCWHIYTYIHKHAQRATASFNFFGLSGVKILVDTMWTNSCKNSAILHDVRCPPSLNDSPWLRGDVYTGGRCFTKAPTTKRTESQHVGHYGSTVAQRMPLFTIWS